MIPLIPKDPMNGLERAYAQRLEFMRSAGELIAWKFEPFRIKTPGGTYYKVDFFLVYEDRFEIHETKGFWRSRDRVRFREAAAVLPWFEFLGVTWEGDRAYNRGEWRWERFSLALRSE